MTSKFNIKFSIGDLVNYNGANSTWLKLNPWKVSSIGIVSGDTDIIYSLESGKEYTHLPQHLLEARTEEKKMTTTKKFYLVYSKDGRVEYEFNTLQAAEDKAREIAENYIGEEFFVMESIAVASVKTTYEKL